MFTMKNLVRVCPLKDTLLETQSHASVGAPGSAAGGIPSPENKHAEALIPRISEWDFFIWRKALYIDKLQMRPH